MICSNNRRAFAQRRFPSVSPPFAREWLTAICNSAMLILSYAPLSANSCRPPGRLLLYSFASCLPTWFTPVAAAETMPNSVLFRLLLRVHSLLGRAPFRMGVPLF